MDYPQTNYLRVSFTPATVDEVRKIIMYNVLQSVYKQFHSIETALLKIHNDFTPNVDKSKVTALTLLGLSATFDTIDHNIFITRLSLWYGISGTALS